MSKKQEQSPSGTLSAESRVVLVTGGTRGIGASIVRHFVEAGDHVEFCYHSRSDLSENMVDDLADELGTLNGTKVDVADYEEVKNWISGVTEKTGRVDVVVNSAGITRDSALYAMKESDWSAVLRTNLDSVFNVCRAVSMPMIRAKSGVIINISSISGVFGNAGQANYSASKSGIIGFSKSLAKELGPFGVRVNVVAPGFIETDMTRDLTRHIDKLMKSVPLRRIGHSDEVAHSVAFLSSNQAQYITGQTLGVDGGLVF